MASAEENDGIGQQHQNNFQNLSFPLAIVHSFKLNMEWFFFGVTLRNDTTLPEEARLEQKLTNIEHIQMVGWEGGCSSHIVLPVGAGLPCRAFNSPRGQTVEHLGDGSV